MVEETPWGEKGRKDNGPKEILGAEACLQHSHSHNFPCLGPQSLHVPCAHLLLPRTMEDPEFPGEDEYLYFVLVEFNIEDIKELKRIIQLELTGTLDPDGVKAFVEAPWQNHFIGIRKNSSMRAPYNGCSLRGVIYGGWQATYENTLVIPIQRFESP